MTLLARLLRWLTRPKECPDCGTDYTCEKCEEERDVMAW